MNKQELREAMVEQIGPDRTNAVYALIEEGGWRLLRKQQGPHGTYGMYVNGECRCDACRKANADAARSYRHRIKAAKARPA